MYDPPPRSSANKFPAIRDHLKRMIEINLVCNLLTLSAIKVNHRPFTPLSILYGHKESSAWVLSPRPINRQVGTTRPGRLLLHIARSSEWQSIFSQLLTLQFSLVGTTAADTRRRRRRVH